MGNILGTVLAGGVDAALGALGGFAKDIREAITGKAILDPNKQAELLLKAQEMEHILAITAMQFEKAQMEGQIAVNLKEAESSSLFKSGARPAVLWVCVGALCYTYLIKPIAPWVLTACGVFVDPMPEVPMGDLIILLGGLLGLGAMRTYEKVKIGPGR